METVTDFIFLGSKITADVDCSYEIKRCLLLGRKAMSNQTSVHDYWKNYSFDYADVFYLFCVYFHYSRRCFKADLTVIYVKECFSYVFLQEFYSVWSYICCCCCCSITKLCLTLCDPMDRSMPGFPVFHYLLGFGHTHVH